MFIAPRDSLPGVARYCAGGAGREPAERVERALSYVRCAMQSDAGELIDGGLHGGQIKTGAGGVGGVPRTGELSFSMRCSSS